MAVAEAMCNHLPHARAAACRWMKGIARRIWTKPEARSLFLYLLLNFGFMFVEVSYGLLANSLGLVSDAVHMLFDCLAVRVEVLGGFVNSILLIFTSFELLVSSVERMLEPPIITHSEEAFVVSCLGFAVNLCGLCLFHDHSHAHGQTGGSAGGCSGCVADECGGSTGGGNSTTVGSSANMRGVFLHILADTLGSVAVVVSTLLVQCCGWTFFDALTSVCISLMLLLLVWPLIQSTSFVLLQRQPSWLDESLPPALVQLVRFGGVRSMRQARFWCVTQKHVEASVSLSVHRTLPVDRAEEIRRAANAHVVAICGAGAATVQLDFDGEEGGGGSRTFLSSARPPAPHEGSRQR
eukprot:CAMPEP_0117604712 /NCGR_PEP_ID=MMETSP0784-20121206/78826_1 /TAXON_ID=39447 /ORGANISM="" /LENGTH=351 /DNA_ID=CAMNT_0005407747 /DNA_START=140 /DNA_END=1191 /DNA_ORIENTATION=+